MSIQKENERNYLGFIEVDFVATSHGSNKPDAQHLQDGKRNREKKMQEKESTEETKPIFTKTAS